MKKLGVLSVTAFILAAIVYVLTMTNDRLFPLPFIIVMCGVLPVVGLIAALCSQKRDLKFIGVIGNVLVLVVTVLIPALSMLFWNTP